MLKTRVATMILFTRASTDRPRVTLMPLGLGSNRLLGLTARPHPRGRGPVVLQRLHVVSAAFLNHRVPEEGMELPPSANVAWEVILAKIETARQGRRVPVTLRLIEEAGLLSEASSGSGMPLKLTRLAHDKGCVVWGPYCPRNSDPYFVVEGHR